jgi:short-subunit dehydrogenase
MTANPAVTKIEPGPHSDPMRRHRGAAVVTGAARGLGLAIATALHQVGYDVMVTDPDPDAAAAAAAPLGGWSARLDVRYDQACEVAAQRAAERGGLALWVNNASALAVGPLWTHDAGTRRRLMETNALGLMNGTLAALSVMRPRGRGHIVNVVSLAGLVAAPGETVYAASKQAALAFSLGTLAELRAAGQRGVHISCLCPEGDWTPNPQERGSGARLRTEHVATRLVRLLDEPRPVVAMSRRSGVRMLDAFPRASLSMARLMLAVGQRRQPQGLSLR